MHNIKFRRNTLVYIFATVIVGCVVLVTYLKDTNKEKFLYGLQKSTYDISGRTVTFKKSSVKGRLDFTRKIGWNEDGNGKKRHYVGYLKKMIYNENYIQITLIDDKGNNLNFRLQKTSDSLTYISVQDLTDSRQVFWYVDKLANLNKSQLEKVIHSGDVIHIAVIVNEDGKIIPKEKGTYFGEYINLRRFGGLKTIIKEMH